MIKYKFKAYVTVWAKPDMFSPKQKFILLAQLIATLK